MHQSGWLSQAGLQSHPDAYEADFFLEFDPVETVKGGLPQLFDGISRFFKGLCPRDRLEITEPHLDRDGLPLMSALFHISDHFSREVGKVSRNLLPVVEVPLEGRLPACRFRLPVSNKGVFIYSP